MKNKNKPNTPIFSHHFKDVIKICQQFDRF